MKKVFKGLLLGVLAIAMVLSMFACADKVDVTFKDGDTVVATVTVEKGKALSQEDFPEAPVKEGYKFLGWYADDTELTAETLISGAITFVAKYEEEVAQATVTFKSEGATVSTKAVDVGTALTAADFPADPTLADYTFLGWYVGETKVEAGYVVNADVTVTAKFAHNTAKVIFKNGDAVLGEKTVNTKTALTAADFPTDPTLADSVFLGWYIGETKVEAGYIVTADLTVTAKFTSDIAKVTFKSGETVLGELVKVVNDTLTAADFPTDPTLAGSHFVGWYVGDEKISAGYAVTADVTVTAKFASDTVKVTFKSGETTIDEVTKATGDALTAADFPAGPTLADYTFLGWYVGETKVEAGYAVTADVTVTAKFAHDVAKVTFKYGESTLDEKTLETKTALAAADFPTDPTLTGHHFVGWYVGETKVEAGYVVTADMTVTAKFEKNTYKISFVVDGEEVTSLDVLYGEAPDENDLPGDPVKAGYEFDGWFAGEDEFDEEAAVKADIVYTAKFTKNAWKVTFTADGAEPQDFYVPMDNAVLTFDQVPAALADTATAHFLGWYSGTIKAKTGVEISEDTVFTAKFVTVDSFTGKWYNEENAYFFTVNGKKVTVAGAECDAVFDVKTGKFSIHVDYLWFYDYVFTVAEDGESLSLVRSYDEWGDGFIEDVKSLDPVLMSALPEGGFTGVYRASNSEIYTVENGVIVKYGTSDSVVYYGTVLPDGDGGYRLVYKSGKTSARMEYAVTVDEKGNWHVTEVGKTKTKIYVANPTDYTYIYRSAIDESDTSETIHIFTLADGTKLYVWTQGDETAYTDLTVTREERGLYAFTLNGEIKTVKVDGKSFTYPGAEAAAYTGEDGVDLKLDGFGYAMLDEVEYTYALNNGVLKLFDLENGEFYLALTLDTEAKTWATKEKDAFAGEYEYYVDFIQTAGVIITLDGYGTATYVYNNGSPKTGSYSVVDGKIIFQNVDYKINQAGTFTPSADGKILTGVHIDYYGDKVRLELKNTTVTALTLDESLFGWYASEDGTAFFRLYKTASGEMFIEGLYDEKVAVTAYWDGLAVCFEAIDTCSEKPGSTKPTKTFYFYLSGDGAVLHHSCDVKDGDGYINPELKKVSYKKLAAAPAVDFPEEVRKTWYNEDNLTLVLDAATLTLGGEEAEDLRFFGTHYAFRVGEAEYILLVKDGKVYLGTTKANATLLSETSAPNKYTVTFVDEEGNEVGTAKVIEGDYLKEADIPAALTKTDAAFLGWYLGDVKAVAGTTTVTSDMTFTAKFRNKADYVGIWVNTDEKVLLNIGKLTVKGDISGKITFSSTTGNLSYLKASDKKVTVELSSDGKSVTYTVYNYDDIEEDFVLAGTYALTKLTDIFDGQNKYQGTSGSDTFTVEANGYISKVGSSDTIYGLLTVEEDGSYTLEYRTSKYTAATTILQVKADANGNWVTKDNSKIYIKNPKSLTAYSNNDTGTYEYLYVYTMTDGSQVVVYLSTAKVSNYATIEGTLEVDSIITFTAGDTTATVKLVKISSYSYGFVYPAAEKGTYTAEGGEDLTLDGFGNATLGEKSYTYLASGTLVVLSAEGEEDLGFTLDMTNHTYTVAQKIGYAGTYNVWQDYQKTAYTLTLDGYGNATLLKGSTKYTGTYAVSADGKSMTFTGLDYIYYHNTWTLSHDGNAMSAEHYNGSYTKYEIVNADYAPTATDISQYLDKYYADASGDAFYLSYNDRWGYEFAFWLDTKRDFWADMYWDGAHLVFEGVDFDTTIKAQKTESRFFLVSFEDGKITLTHRCATGFDDDGEVTFGFVSVTYTACEQPAVYIADELLGTWYTAEGSTVVIAKNKVTVNGVESTELNASVYYGITYTALVGGVEYTLSYDDYGKAVWFGATALFEGELPVLLTSMPDDATNSFLGKWNGADDLVFEFAKAGAMTYDGLSSVYAIKDGKAYFLATDGETLMTATISGNTMTVTYTPKGDEMHTLTFTKDGAEPEEPTHDAFYGVWVSESFTLTFEDGGKVTYDNGSTETVNYTIQDGKACFEALYITFECTLSDDGASLEATMDDGEGPFSKKFTKQTTESHDAFYGVWAHGDYTLTFEDGGKVTYYNDNNYTVSYTLSSDGKVATFANAGGYDFVCTLSDDGTSFAAVLDDGEYQLDWTFTKQ